MWVLLTLDRLKLLTLQKVPENLVLVDEKWMHVNFLAAQLLIQIYKLESLPWFNKQPETIQRVPPPRLKFVWALIINFFEKKHFGHFTLR